MSEQVTTKNSDDRPLVERLNELAVAAQKQRKDTPLASVSMDIRIAPKEILKRITKPQGGNDAENGEHYLFVPGDDQTLRRYANRGYLIHLEDGEMVRNGADVVVKCPTWMYEDELQANSARSNRMVASNVNKHKADMRQNKTSASDDDNITVAQLGPERGRRGRPPKRHTD